MKVAKRKRKKTYNFLIIFCIGLNLLAQDKIIYKSPKVISFELGYRNILNYSNISSIPNSGYTLLFDYAWQLSGFQKNKAAAFISVPLGYTLLPASGANPQTSFLSYGWTVKHNLSRSTKIIPFFGYALLLNNMRIDNIKGSIMGHQTRFEFGVLFPKIKPNPYIKLDYSYTSFARLEEKERIKFHTTELKLGISINKKKE